MKQSGYPLVHLLQKPVVNRRYYSLRTIPQQFTCTKISLNAERILPLQMCLEATHKRTLAIIALSSNKPFYSCLPSDLAYESLRGCR